MPEKMLLEEQTELEQKRVELPELDKASARAAGLNSNDIAKYAAVRERHNDPFFPASQETLDLAQRLAEAAPNGKVVPAMADRIRSAIWSLASRQDRLV